MADEKHPYRVPFLNTAFDNVDIEQVREVVAEHVRTREPGYMVSLNTDIDIALEHDPEFKSAHRDATLVLMDSQPLFELAGRQGVPVKEKIAGSDLMGPVCEWAAQEGWSIYIFGGMPGVPEQAAENLRQRYPGLKVAGTQSPEYGFEKHADTLVGALKPVTEASPDILFVCLGAPKSEKLVHAHLTELSVPFTFIVGAAVDFAAGNVKRAPKWMSDYGLEWLYRFSQEPRRLFKRYFVDSWQVLDIIRRYGDRACGGRIAIDLTSLADNFSGIERYAANIAKSLIEQDNEDSFVLLFKESVFPWFEGLERRDNVEIRVIPRGLGGKAVFSQVTLPRVLDELHPELALFLAFPCPLTYTGSSVSAIHDLTCFDCPDTMTNRSRLYWRAAADNAVRGSKRVITVSEFSKSRIVERYAKDPGQVTVARDGVDRALFNEETGRGREAEVRERYGLPGRFVLSLSTIEPRKRLDLLVGAWGELWDEGAIERDLVLAGRKGWKVDELLAGLSEDARAHVCFTGFVEDADLPVLYRMGEPFVFPSRYEGFGLPPVEAHDSGARVLCSDIPCLKEICGDKVAYFRSGDKDDLKRALTDPHLFDGVSTEPLEYSWDVEARKVLELFRGA